MFTDFILQYLIVTATIIGLAALAFGPAILAFLYFKMTDREILVPAAILVLLFANVGGVVEATKLLI